MEKKGPTRLMQRIKLSGQKLMRSVGSPWRDRWLAWVSLGLMVVVTVGGLFYLATDWSRPYQGEEDDFYWSEPLSAPEKADALPLEEAVGDQPLLSPSAVPTANPPLAEQVAADVKLPESLQEADPGPEPEVALVPVMAPGQAFADLASPVQAEVTSPFGWRRHPVFADWRYHPGVDLDASLGTEVKAVLSGTVVEVKQDDVWGKLVVVDHGGQRKSTYAHLDQAEVEVDQVVEQGQTVGTVGQTGIASQPHLHLELRLEGTAVDPALYLPFFDDATPAQGY